MYFDIFAKIIRSDKSIADDVNKKYFNHKMF